MCKEKVPLKCLFFKSLATYLPLSSLYAVIQKYKFEPTSDYENQQKKIAILGFQALFVVVQQQKQTNKQNKKKPAKSCGNQLLYNQQD